MPTLQAEYITMLEAFARLFSKRIWEHAKVLLMGPILCPAERTVTAVLRVMGLSSDVVGAHSVGPAGLRIAVSHGAGTFRALLQKQDSRSYTCPGGRCQGETHSVGTADG